ncbi:MAG: DNA methyltransferase [Methylococcales bacterium]
MNHKNQLELPLEIDVLEGLDATGTTAGAIQYVATKRGISENEVLKKVSAGKRGEVSGFKRKIRWIQQTLKQQGLAVPVKRGSWSVTLKGKNALNKIKSGHLSIAFTTELGVALWGDCRDLPKLFKNEIDLIVTSPPYKLQQEREYGNVKGERAYLDWFLSRADEWLQLMRTPSSSIVVNLGDIWNPQEASLSLYKEKLLLELHEKLGLKLCQRFEWLNPAKPAAPIDYVARKRIRVKPSLETIWWLSLEPNNVNADNRRVLEDYLESTKKLIANGGMKETAYRPSGHRVRAGSFSEDQGGRIPHNLIVSGPEGANSHYCRSCRDNGIPIHPARFPLALPRFFINMLISDKEQMTADPFFGGGMTGQAAELNGSRWVGTEQVLEYLMGAKHRFGLI